jgi:hypothetical protein
MEGLGDQVRFLAVLLGGIVSLFTICATILGVGWKLGQIASGIRLEIAEIKGILAVSAERIAQIERRVERLESINGDHDGN